MRHGKEIESYVGRLPELAREVTDLRYKELTMFYQYMADYLILDAFKDRTRGRKQLSERLERTAELLTRAGEEMADIWHLCEPYMEDEDEV